MILFIALCAARRFDHGGVLSDVLINQIVVSESMYMLWALQFDLHWMAAVEPFSLPLFVLWPWLAGFACISAGSIWFWMAPSAVRQPKLAIVSKDLTSWQYTWCLLRHGNHWHVVCILLSRATWIRHCMCVVCMHQSDPWCQFWTCGSPSNTSFETRSWTTRFNFMGFECMTLAKSWCKRCYVEAFYEGSCDVFRWPLGSSVEIIVSCKSL